MFKYKKYSDSDSESEIIYDEDIKIMKFISFVTMCIIAFALYLAC